MLIIAIKAELAKTLNITQKEARGVSVQLATTYKVPFALSFQKTSPT